MAAMISPTGKIAQAREGHFVTDDNGEFQNATVLFRLASGTSVGRTLGAFSEKIVIGSGRRCHIRLAEHTGTTGSVPSKAALLERTPEGWVLRIAKGVDAFLNQRNLNGPILVRSGDVLRITHEGPDVQMLLQHPGQRSLATIAREYGMQIKPVPDCGDDHSETKDNSSGSHPNYPAAPHRKGRRRTLGQLWDKLRRRPRSAAAIAASLLLGAAAVWTWYPSPQPVVQPQEELAAPDSLAPAGRSLAPPTLRLTSRLR